MPKLNKTTSWIPEESVVSPTFSHFEIRSEFPDHILGGIARSLMHHFHAVFVLGRFGKARWQFWEKRDRWNVIYKEKSKTHSWQECTNKCTNKWTDESGWADARGWTNESDERINLMDKWIWCALFRTSKNERNVEKIWMQRTDRPHLRTRKGNALGRHHCHRDRPWVAKKGRWREEAKSKREHLCAAAE